MLAPSLSALRVATRQASPSLRRAYHPTNTVGNNTPFDYQNRKAFTAKLIAFVTLGWSVPFVACGYQQWKIDHA
ncbi:hypothetical protein RQP46_010051 [Phenoliferia psychrophenolica]